MTTCNKKKILTTMGKLGLTLGSFELSCKVGKDGTPEKIPRFICDTAGKRAAPEIVTDPKYNAYYFQTGAKNNVIMVDLDDMKNSACTDVYEMAYAYSNVVIKTRKGYHFYFTYSDSFPSNIQGKQYGVPIDIRSTGGIVYCPPTQYKIPDGTIVEYTIKKHKAGGINAMPKCLELYLLNLFKNQPMQKNKPEPENVDEPTTSKNVDNTPKLAICDNFEAMEPEFMQEDEKEEKKETANKPDKKYKMREVDTSKILNRCMVELIYGLAPMRSINYDSWVEASFCFFNSGYPFVYFDLFSKLYYEKYDVADVRKQYMCIKGKNKKKTDATLWMWLKEDNVEKFNELVERVHGDKYKINIKDYAKFSLTVFGNLLAQDEKELGKFHYLTLEKTRAYQYYNYYHVYYGDDGTLYRTGDDAPKPVKSTETIGFYVKNPINEKNEEFGDLWLRRKESRRRRIQKFVFNPDPSYVQNDDVYNLFDGFKFTVIDYNMEIVAPFINHVKRLCNDDQKIYNYVLDWFAHIFQIPHKKIGTAILMYSTTQGTGKNLLIEVIQALLGKYCLALPSSTSFNDHFNSHMMGKLLYYTDEVSARMAVLDSELKNVITRAEIPVTFKGKETFHVDDFGNHFMMTNNNVTIKAPASDRRMEIIHISEDTLPVDLIAPIVEIKESSDKLQHLFSYFMKRDIQGHDLRDIPMTEYKKELIINDMPAYIRMFAIEPMAHAGHDYTIGDIYGYSMTFGQTHRMNTSYTKPKVAQDINMLFGKYACTKNHQLHYILPSNLPDIIDNLIESTVDEIIKKTSRH